MALHAVWLPPVRAAQPSDKDILSKDDMLTNSLGVSVIRVM
jgi:hypothetical protein